MARQIVVELVGDDKKFKGTLDAAEGKVGGFQNALKGVGVGVGFAAFNAVTGAVSGLVDTLGEADAAFQEDARSQGVLKAALAANAKGWDGNTESIEKRIAAQMRLGFGDEEQRDSLANLTAITKDVTEAQELQTLAMDLARLKGMDLAAASDLVGKVAGGNLGTLSRYGIILGDNATKEEALAAIQSMAAGQAEAFAAGPLGRQEAAQLRVGEAMEKIGSVVNRVTTVVLPIAADAFSNLVDWLFNTWTAIEPGVSALVKDLTPAFQTVVSILGVVIDIIGRVVGAVLPPFVAYVRFVASVWANVFGTIVSVISGAAGTIGTIIGNIRGTFTGIVDFISGLPGRIGRAASGMWDGIWQAFRGAINAIIRGWNSIKFTIPKIEFAGITVGGFTIGTPNIPTLHAGGIVPGVPGSDVPAILQAGEQVIPRSRVGGPTISIHIENFTGSDGDIDRLADRLAMRLRLQGV